MEGNMGQQALDFLFYTSFGIKLYDIEKNKNGINNTGKQKKKIIIKTAIDKAYDDATLQGAYNTYIKRTKKNEEGTEIGEEKEKLRIASQDTRDKCISYLLGDTIDSKGAIEKLLDSKGNYDKIHRDTCDNIYQKYHKGDNKYNISIEFFSYGNAQKWINMTMKYLYVICGIMEECNRTAGVEVFCKRVSDEAKYFHVPIDSFILEALRNEMDESAFIIIDNNGSATIKYRYDQNSKDYVLTSEGKDAMTTSWSSIDSYELYDKIREYINQAVDNENEENKKNKIPIEWEADKWIEIKESRKQRKLEGIS